MHVHSPAVERLYFHLANQQHVYWKDDQQIGIRLTEKETIHLCLTEIENMLQANRRSLRDFPSMPYPIGYARNQHHNNLIHNEMAYDKEMLAEQYNTAYQLLTVLGVLDQPSTVCIHAFSPIP
ncbi:hypothetical protein JHK86_015823 [Glycine max]|nr:hypothetical protein JHK86_015823 [Glycine max]